MFKLDTVNAKLTSVNPRSELHGEDTQMACDLKFSMTVSNTTLDMFDKDLRAALFTKARKEDMDLAEQGSDHPEDFTPLYRFPDLGKLSWSYEGAGYRLVIHQGFSGEEDLVLIQTKIDKFRFTCKQGGSIDIDFRVVAHPNAKDMGKLCELIQNEVDITLEPPTPEQQAQMELDAEREEEEAA